MKSAAGLRTINSPCALPWGVSPQGPTLYCTGFGWLLRGLSRAIVTLFTASIPCAALVAVFNTLPTAWQDNQFAQIAIRGSRSRYRLVGITIKTSWTIAKPYFKGSDRLGTVLTAGVAFLLYVVTAIPPIEVLILAAVFGAFLPLPSNECTLALSNFAQRDSDRVRRTCVLAGHSERTRVSISRADRSAVKPSRRYHAKHTGTGRPLALSVGYFVAGIPGAIAGWAAMVTPALLIIPLVHFVGRKLENPRVKHVKRTFLMASAGLLLAAAIPLAYDALTGPITVAIMAVTVVLLLTTELDTLCFDIRAF